MKRIVYLLVIVCSLFGFTYAQGQVDPMNLPQLTLRVNDFSDVLTTSQSDELNTVAKDYETQTSSQLVTVLFPNRNGNELIDIGMKVFTDNGIGQKDINNGLLLLISTEEKKIRIVVGYGLEGAYPDLMASQVIENDIRPLVNSGDFFGAVQAFYDRSIQILSGEIPAGYTSVDSSSSSSKDDSSIYIGLLLGFFIGLFLRRFLKKGFKELNKSVKKRLGIGLSLFFVFAFVAGIYLVGTFLLFLFFGIIFGLVGLFPSRLGGGGFGSGFGGSFGGGGFSSGGGGFSGGGGSSGGGGAGD